jgi:ion channel-forming bestrophin family protein
VIVRDKPGPLQLLLAVRGSVLPHIAPTLAVLVLISTAMVLLDRTILPLKHVNATPFAVFGVALSLFLGFRNNAAYDRWWEARKLWGQLVFDIRNLCRASTAMIGDREELRPFLMDSLAFCHFLRGELRKVDTRGDARVFIGDAVDRIATATNQPDAMLRRMGARLGALKRAGALEAMDFRILDERLSTMAALQAGCERIMGTPLPFAYTLLLHRTAYIFCLLLPFGLAFSAGWATPLFTALIAYTFFGLDALSEEMEDPFGMEANDLALDGLCRVCEISVFEALGEAPPPMIPAAKFYFS